MRKIQYGKHKMRDFSARQEAVGLSSNDCNAYFNVSSDQSANLYILSSYSTNMTAQ